ncbi:hypothetical protein HIM_11421 [Hirsutella minnesotensis 3608]|uniref:ATP-dependent DNA helicase n=1 Tax=Hirsutella minnesotensis 3608 TaxID=1043627 RepID=A0A0F7ZR88_9HYPO|nr:hypothetical protein HIM_11421 [Hirsutella minnesotensis 3608]
MGPGGNRRPPPGPVTPGTAAARINGITIHSACGFSKDQGTGANTAKDLDRVRIPKRADRFVHGQSRMDWQEKDVLVIDEVSMLGARTLHAVNEQLCRLRGLQRDFGGIPIVLFCGDFHQFRPVQERSILLPSAAVLWDVDNSFKAERRHQHDKAHALWKKFTTVVMLDEQMRAAGDPELQRLLKRVRLGVQDRTDLDILNSRCYREGRRIPWEAGITVVTPLNRNRWNLNMEASLAFQTQQPIIDLMNDFGLRPPYAKRWWTKDLTRLRQTYTYWRNQARAQRRASQPQPDLEQRAKDAAKEYHDNVRKQKKSHWDDFVTDENNIWKVVKYLKPGIATTLRGRPKNTTEPVPEAMAVKRLGRECRGGRAAVGKINTDREPRNKTFALGPGKQTGVRHAGHRRQPSVRRRRSEWETISDDEEPEPPSKRRCRSSRKWPTTSAPTAVSSFGSKENRGDCINVRM